MSQPLLRTCSRIALAGLLLVSGMLAAAPGTAQAPKLSMFNLKREIYGPLWGGSPWLAFAVDEDEKDLNRDNDADDTLVAVMDLRTFTAADPGLATDPALSDSEDDWPVSASDSLVAVQVSETDQGSRDLNANRTTTDNVLALYNPTARTLLNLAVTGKYARFLDGKLYFSQPEAIGRKDLNGDGDLSDSVLCVYDPATKQTQSLSMEAALGFKLAAGWIATLTSEAGQRTQDLNADGDLADVVVQVYDLAKRAWENTALEGSGGVVLTPKLLAVGVDEQKQGGKDLNGDTDTADIVCAVRDLTTGASTNTALDCREGLVADGTLVGFSVDEMAQGKRDLNGDKDTNDTVAYAYVVGTSKNISINRDAGGGMVAAGGKLVFGCTEQDQGSVDLNRDRDMDDIVIHVFDPVGNVVTNTAYSIDGDLASGEGYVAWKVLESDQGGRDLNRDLDLDDGILHVLEVATNAVTSTGWAAGETHLVTARGVAFTTFEADQGDRDLNTDGDTDDEILQYARFAK